MADIGFRIIYLEKRFPLTIGRGVIAGGDTLPVSVSGGGLTGRGEAAPVPRPGSARRRPLPVPKRSAATFGREGRCAVVVQSRRVLL